MKGSLLQRQPYKLVLMDVNMPMMSGIEAARQMDRAIRSSACSSVAIIGLTGDSSEGVMKQCKGAGMLDVIMKPCSRALMINTLKKHGILPAFSAYT